MQATLDGRPLAAQPTSIAQALIFAREQAEHAGRLVIEVRADGDPAEAWIETPPADTAGVERLELVSAPAGPFIAQVLRDGLASLDAVEVEQQRAAELIQTGQIPGAMHPVRTVLDGWGLLQQAVDYSHRLLKIELGSLRIAAVNTAAPAASPSATTISGTAAVDDLAADLRELRDGLRGHDWTTVSDVLGYDLHDRAEQWRSLLHGLIERAEAAPAEGRAGVGLGTSAAA